MFAITKFKAQLEKTIPQGGAKNKKKGFFQPRGGICSLYKKKFGREKKFT